MNKGLIQELWLVYSVTLLLISDFLISEALVLGLMLGA